MSTICVGMNKMEFAETVVDATRPEPMLTVEIGFDSWLVRAESQMATSVP